MSKNIIFIIIVIIALIILYLCNNNSQTSDWLDFTNTIKINKLLYIPIDKPIKTKDDYEQIENSYDPLCVELNRELSNKTYKFYTINFKLYNIIQNYELAQKIISKYNNDQNILFNRTVFQQQYENIDLNNLSDLNFNFFLKQYITGGDFITFGKINTIRLVLGVINDYNTIFDIIDKKQAYRNYIKNIISTDNDNNKNISLLYNANLNNDKGNVDIIDLTIEWINIIYNLITYTFICAIIMLDTHPNIKEKLQEELESHVDIYSSSTYLHYISCEVMRMYKYPIRYILDISGIQTIINKSIIDFNEKYFPDYDRFNPDRWKNMNIRYKIDEYYFDYCNLLLKKFLYDATRMNKIIVNEPILDRNNLPQIINIYKFIGEFEVKKIVKTLAINAD